MINTNPHTYVQYVTKNGFVKVKQVEREVDGTNVFYNLDGINEEFFILGLYDLNKRVFGVTFSNIQNLDMIAFLNSDFQTVELLPEISFLPPLQFVAMVVDTLNYDINFDVVPFVVPQIKYPFDPFRYYIDLNAGNKEIEGISLTKLTSSDFLIKEGVYTDIDGTRVYQNDVFASYQVPNWWDNSITINTFWFDFLGFNIKVVLDTGINSSFSFDFLVDTKYNIFDIVSRELPTFVQYHGFYNGEHMFLIGNNLEAKCLLVYVTYQKRFLK